MNPRQRRGALLLGLSVIGAIAVFFSVSNYVADVRAEVGVRTTVLTLADDVDAYEPVAGQLQLEQVPLKWAPESALHDELETAGMVAATDLREGAYLQPGMLVPEPAVQGNQRELALLVDVESGVGLKVRPEDRVDVIASFQGNPPVVPPHSEVIASCVRVIDVSLEQIQRTLTEGDEVTEQTVFPVTFALARQQYLAIAYARAFASHIQLGLTSPAVPCAPTAGAVFPPGAQPVERSSPTAPGLGRS